MRCTLGEANHSPTCSKAVSPRRTASTHQRRSKMGRYGAGEGLAKMLDTSLRYHEAYGIVVTSFFGFGTKNTSFWPKSQI